MKNYTVTPITSPVDFELRDENGNLIAFCLDEATANVFEHVPALLDVLDGFVSGMPGEWADAVELQEKLKPFRK